jgi:hypothetical protein
MVDWFARFRRKASAPLTGAPAIRRQKTYTAGTGWVYEYFYQGRRAAGRNRRAAIEFVFSVSADRRNWFPVSVFLIEADLADWERDLRRLSATECYAIAKISLFQAFDEREPAQIEREIVVQRGAIDTILNQLGLD